LYEQNDIKEAINMPIVTTCKIRVIYGAAKLVAVPILQQSVDEVQQSSRAAQMREPARGRLL